MYKHEEDIKAIESRYHTEHIDKPLYKKAPTTGRAVYNRATHPAYIDENGQPTTDPTPNPNLLTESIAETPSCSQSIPLTPPVHRAPPPPLHAHLSDDEQFSLENSTEFRATRRKKEQPPIHPYFDPVDFVITAQDYSDLNDFATASDDTPDFDEEEAASSDHRYASAAIPHSSSGYSADDSIDSDQYSL
jgi:hypothetical protein